MVKGEGSSEISTAKLWIERLGGRPACAMSFAASRDLAVGHFHFDGLAEEIEAPALPLHYISVTLGGPLRIEARLGGEKVRARVLPGQSMIMVANRSNAWTWDGPTEEAHVFMHPDFLANVSAEVGDGRVDLLDRMAFEDARLRQTILTLAEEMARFGRIPPIFLDMGADLLARRLLKHCGGRRKASGTAPQGILSARQLRRVLAFVEDRLGDDISLDDLAGIAGLSRFHFTRAFKATVGKSPYRWLVELRIEFAKELLRKRNVPIIDVAAQVGFESQSHFGHVFLAQVGMTPREWRRRAVS